MNENNPSFQFPGNSKIMHMESVITSSFAVHFNKTAYKALGNHLEEKKYSKIFILVDDNTKIHCLPLFLDDLNGKYKMEILEIPSGEVHKNISTCLEIWQKLSDLDADRKSLLINLGGGVVTDLGGFVASTFKRGIDFINIPTTLLAMVDASIGGKTGVDLGAIKNQIGVINQPKMVLVVPLFLKTLNDRQLHSGFAEMLKHGLIQNDAYWQKLKSVSDFNNLEKLIYESVLIKNKVVLEDPTEQNIRKTLNFGHTLGHAIESCFLENSDKVTLLHGEAIAIGMILETYISYRLTGLSEGQLVDITTTFLNRYGKVDIVNEDIQNILSLLKYDKKNSHGNINFVLLETIGKPLIDIHVSNQLITDSFTYYKEH